MQVYRRVLIKRRSDRQITTDGQSDSTSSIQIKKEADTESNDRGSDTPNENVYMDLIQFYNIVSV